MGNRSNVSGKSLHQCHFVHLIPHMNWRTWVPAVRDMRLTAWIKARSPDGRMLESREVPVYTAERKIKLVLCFPHRTGFTMSFQRLCIGFYSYRSNSASVSPSPRKGRISFSGHSVPNSRNRKAPWRFLVFTVSSNNVPFRGQRVGGSNTAYTRISSG
jgi:hypothetical protein